MQEPAETDVDVTVSRCLSALRALSEKAGVRIEANLGSGQARLAVDRRSLMQILLNLLSNALKFTPRGGAVTVETRRNADGGLVLTVSDTGPGLPADELQRIHKAEPLPTVARARHGSGYGLPLVRVLARAAGATVEIGSRPGQGTRVWLTFPLDRLVESGTGPRN